MSLVLPLHRISDLSTYLGGSFLWVTCFANQSSDSLAACGAISLQAFAVDFKPL